MLLNIRVVKADGSSLTGSDAMVRYLGYYVNTFVFFVGWIWASFDDKKRGWHDLFAKTIVVSAKSS